MRSFPCIWEDIGGLDMDFGLQKSTVQQSTSSRDLRYLLLHW